MNSNIKKINDRADDLLASVRDMRRIIRNLEADGVNTGKLVVDLEEADFLAYDLKNKIEGLIKE
ncbi:MAG: hypothetical protein M1355_01805 [Patescibacteria group bacterium]|nr:hypothetical protein [Patescibacteria group bacterium]